MKSLRQVISDAQRQGVAIGHFNFSTFDVAQAIVNAAKSQNVPVILGLSEGERDFVGHNEAVTWVRQVNVDIEKEKQTNKNITNVFVYLNADHTYSFEKVKEATDAGFDMVIYDDAGGDLEKNISEAVKCREYIKSHNKKVKSFLNRVKILLGLAIKLPEVLLEAELGYIGKSSKVLTELPEGLQKTNPEVAKKFVEAVGPDLLAPAIGNVHGMLKDVPDPNLDEKLCSEIFNTVKIPLVLHGASGNSKEDIQACIKSGVAVVHVNTELRVAYKNALEKVRDEKEVAPYKYMKTVEDAVQKVVEEKIKVFNFRS
jgi:fructose-bisphosphate aldolase class II